MMYHNRINLMMNTTSQSGIDEWINAITIEYIYKTGKSIALNDEHVQISLSASKNSGLFPDVASKKLIEVINAIESLN